MHPAYRPLRSTQEIQSHNNILPPADCVSSALLNSRMQLDSPPTPVFRSGGSARYSAGADVNGDGNPDILASSDQAATNGELRGVLTVLFGQR